MMSRRPIVTECLICGIELTFVRRGKIPEKRKTAGRGLCHTCWCAAKVNGTLDQFPRLTRSRDELLSEWEFMRGMVSFDDFSKVMGVTLAAWKCAYSRGEKAGDPRAKGRR